MRIQAKLPPARQKKINPEEDILIVRKPRGLTSHDVVAAIKEISGAKKVGHAGTLDQLAEGVLIILIGKATKRQSEFLNAEKEYLAAIRFGGRSNTDDAEGNIVETTHPQKPAKDKIIKILQRFSGNIEQIPPAFSAIKIQGRKAYEFARRGIQPPLKPRHIYIREIKILSYRWPILKIRVICSSGTYVRSLARDIGKALKVGGYIQSLVRTRSGTFDIRNAVPFESIR